MKSMLILLVPGLVSIARGVLSFGVRFCRGSFAIPFLLLVAIVPAVADTNSWTKSTSGNWDDPSAWSLEVLPSSSQSVLIENSGWKAVAINPSTPVNFPGSMTASNLTIRGAWDTENTLLLNYFGTAVPLTVLNDFNLGPNGRLQL